MTTTRTSTMPRGTTGARPSCPPAPPPPSGTDGASFPVPAAPFQDQQKGPPAPPPGPESKPAAGRDGRGRFIKGHPGGPGRPRRAVEVEYLAALGSVVTIDAWRKVCETALKQAIEGDDRAREFLARHVLGARPLSLAAVAAAEASAGQGQRLGDPEVLEALAQQIGHWIYKRFGDMLREFDLAEQIMEEVAPEEAEE